MSKKEDMIRKKYCQDCGNYKRPVCKHENSGKDFTARKSTCEWWKLKVRK